ncbi:MAG: adenosine deaminase [Gemmatimonadota bacterium]
MSREVTRERLRALPKAELHVHLDGSLRPATMMELARRGGIALPASDPDGLARAMRAQDSRSLVEYLEKFAITLPLLQRQEALERTAYELGEDAAAENIRYLEVRYSPILHTQGGMSLEEAVEAPLRGLAAAEHTFGIRTGLIICGLRHLDASSSLELAELAVAYRDQGVVAFDLAGREAGNPARTHREAFHYAADHNLAITIHAGEADGAGSIAQAIHECHARRIGHGTRLLEDPALEAYVNDFRIPLEVCLTSNVQTRVASSYREHPFRRYFDAGLVVTLNTDNRLVSGTTLTEEYWLAHQHLGLGWEELKEVALLGFQAAFLPYEAKVNLLEEVEEEIRGFEEV